jgi:transcription-repair coupling factor (superfamily II helicase)
VNLDFLATHPGAEVDGKTEPRGTPATGAEPPPAQKPAPPLEINVPRDTWSYREDETQPEPPAPRARRPVERAVATIPLDYIREPVERIEVYRKLAQATDQPDLDALQAELRDRFGPLPSAVDLLLLVAELKLLAAGRNVTAIETKEDKLVLLRNSDYLTVGGKFPRLTRTQPKARLNEIRKLLLALVKDR